MCNLNKCNMKKITNTFVFNVVMTLLMMVGLIISILAFDAIKFFAVIGIVGCLIGMIYFVNKSHSAWRNQR